MPVRLLDVSVVFDCDDHAILLQRLEVVIGLNDAALDWIRSFLTDRTQLVAYSGRLLSVELVLFGVPQGSVLGPLLYVLYTAELDQIVVSHGLHLHSYADNYQIYLSTPVEHVPLGVHKFTTCSRVADG